MGLLLAVGNLKGGVGKSTLAVNLASAFASDGRRTVLLDTDPQQTAARWAQHRLLPCEVVEAPIRDVTGAGSWVSYAEGVRRGAEVVVVDLPAVLSAALAAACLLADAVLVPSGTSRVDVTTLQRTLHYLRAARRERGGTAPQGWIVPTRTPRPGFLRRRAGLGPLPRLGEPLTPPLWTDPAFEAAFAAGRWIGAEAPGSRAHTDLLAIKRTVEEGLAGAAPAAPEPGFAERLAARGRHPVAPRPTTAAAPVGPAWPGELPTGRRRVAGPLGGGQPAE